MASPPPPTDAERIRNLEQQVRELNARLSELEPRRRRQVSRGVAAAVERRRAVRWSFRGEQWTGRIGLFLLFLGLVFLFRYSVEQGWITPLVRVLFGGALGSAFLVAGVRTAARRASYGAILLAGSLATYYASGWAASYLYELLARPIAFGWMAAVTLLAFSLARRYEQPALASLGALGGFATPFLLRPDSSTVAELVVYTLLVLAWTTASYVDRRWRSVIWTALVGALAVLAIGAGQAAGGERWLVQAALVMTWTAAAAYPFLQEARRASGRDPYRGALIPFAIELRAMGVGGSATALTITAALWSLDNTASGALFLLVGGLFGAFAWYGTRTPNFVARSAAPVAGALVSTGSFLVLGDGAARWWMVGLLGTTAFLYGERTSRFRGLEWVGHGLFVLAGVALVAQVVGGTAEPFGALALAHLAAIVMAAFASVYLRQPAVRLGYRAVAHVLVLAWLADQFSAVSADSEWVTVAWGVYGVALLIAALEVGRRQRSYRLGAQAFAASALALAVLKLLVIDMAQVSALVRIALFLGSGLALIAVSALFQRAITPRENGEPRSTGPTPQTEMSGD